MSSVKGQRSKPGGCELRHEDGVENRRQCLGLQMPGKFTSVIQKETNHTWYNKEHHHPPFKLSGTQDNNPHLLILCDGSGIIGLANPF